MTHLIIYGNTRSIKTFTQEGKETNEISPDCIEAWKTALKTYSVSSACIQVVSDAKELYEQLKQNEELKRKVTVIIPGGYLLGVYDSFNACEIMNLLPKMILEGKANCLGSCVGMSWMVMSESFIERDKAFFPECSLEYSFQEKQQGSHLEQEKAPIVKSDLIPGEPFHSYWNSGNSVIFGPKAQLEGLEKVTSIGDYPELNAQMLSIFKEKATDPEWVHKDGTPLPERNPHAGVMRINNQGGVAIGLGFHPEISLKPEDITSGISYEENQRRCREFLHKIFERLEIPKSPL